MNPFVKISDGTQVTIHDRVKYIPNHAAGNGAHPDCEIGMVTSIRDGGIWVRYEKQHSTAPGQKTDPVNLVSWK